MRACKRALLGISVLLMLIATVLGIRAWKNRRPYAVVWSKSKLDVFAMASTNYHDVYKAWPESLSAIISDSHVFVAPDFAPLDGWEHQIQYEPFNETLGFGVVRSFGEDGKLGGNGASADIEVYFGKIAVSQSKSNVIGP